MNWKVLDIKSMGQDVDYAIKTLEMEMELAKRGGVIAMKVIHGYGSNGIGGSIALALRAKLKKLKSRGELCYLTGQEWDLANEKTQRLLTECTCCYNDEDLGHRNPGITIIIL